MRRWLCVVLAACGGTSTPSDSAQTSATLTVTSNGVGMVVSTPAGIQCGACAVPMGCPGPQSGTMCASEFPVGTTITLRLSDQETYNMVNCAPTPSTEVTHVGLGCELALAQSTKVIVMGSAAVGRAP